MPATILCTDDNRDFCQILSKALSGEGYRVLIAHDGERALELLEASAPDLVLLDVMLPRRDGFETLEAIRSLAGPLGQLPVLLTSGCRITPQYRARASQLGAAAILAKPVPLDLLLREVRSHLKASPPSVEKGSAPRRRRRGAASKGRADAPLAGSLEELSFPQLLHHLHGMRASGVLHLSCGRKRKAVQLREGYPSAVVSNLVNECLGNLLLRRGWLDRRTYEESVRRVKNKEGLQGQILVAMEVMSEEDIAAALHEQAEEKLIEVFSWQRGRFKFEIGKRLRRGNALSLEGSPANLILEGVRRRYSLEKIDSFLQARSDQFVARGESAFYRLQEIDLSGAEQRMLAGLDGSRSLGEFATTDEAVRRTLFGLLVTELIHLHPRPRHNGPERRPQSPAPRSTRPDAQHDRALREELAAMAERMRGQSHFEVLGVTEYADDEKIQQTYDELLTRVHPDRFKHANGAVRQLAKEVSELIANAHQTLSDPARRRAYVRKQRQGERAAAEQEEGRKALEAEIQFQQGEACLRQRSYETALQHFGAALALYSSEGEYHAHYGWCLHLCHPDDSVMVQEAIEHVKRGVKLARDHEKPYLYLGRLYKAIGRGGAAERMFTRAVEIRSDCVEALRELRLINLRRQKNTGLMRKLWRRGD